MYADNWGVQTVMQAVTVKGTVVDASGEPVIGASVLMKGTTTGTITDIDGNFSLANVKPGILVVSYIGYKTQEIQVKGGTPVKVVLEEDSEVLDEVVVVGYGTQKKSSLTGAVTVVDEKIFKDPAQAVIARRGPMQADAVHVTSAQGSCVRTVFAIAAAQMEPPAAEWRPASQARARERMLSIL